MQMATSLESDNGEMIVKRVSVPIGLEELMEGLTKEVVLKKPKDIYVFASEYFSHLLNLREKGNYKAFSGRRTQSIIHQTTREHVVLTKSKSVGPAVKQLTKQISVRSDLSSKKPTFNAIERNKLLLDKRKLKKQATDIDKKSSSSNSEKDTPRSVRNDNSQKKTFTKRDRSVTDSNRGTSSEDERGKPGKNTPRKKIISEKSKSSKDSLRKSSKELQRDISIEGNAKKILKRSSSKESISKKGDITPSLAESVVHTASECSSKSDENLDDKHMSKITEEVEVIKVDNEKSHKTTVPLAEGKDKTKSDTNKVEENEGNDENNEIIDKDDNKKETTKKTTDENDKEIEEKENPVDIEENHKSEKELIKTDILTKDETEPEKITKTDIEETKIVTNQNEKSNKSDTVKQQDGMIEKDITETETVTKDIKEHTLTTSIKNLDEIDKSDQNKVEPEKKSSSETVSNKIEDGDKAGKHKDVEEESAQNQQNIAKENVTNIKEMEESETSEKIETIKANTQHSKDENVEKITIDSSGQKVKEVETSIEIEENKTSENKRLTDDKKVESGVEISENKDKVDEIENSDIQATDHDKNYRSNIATVKEEVNKKSEIDIEKLEIGKEYINENKEDIKQMTTGKTDEKSKDTEEQINIKEIEKLEESGDVTKKCESEEKASQLVNETTKIIKSEIESNNDVNGLKKDASKEEDLETDKIEEKHVDKNKVDNIKQITEDTYDKNITERDKSVNIQEDEKSENKIVNDKISSKIEIDSQPGELTRNMDESAEKSNANQRDIEMSIEELKMNSIEDGENLEEKKEKSYVSNKDQLIEDKTQKSINAQDNVDNQQKVVSSHLDKSINAGDVKSEIGINTSDESSKKVVESEKESDSKEKVEQSEKILDKEKKKQIAKSIEKTEDSKIEFVDSSIKKEIKILSPKSSEEDKIKDIDKNANANQGLVDKENKNDENKLEEKISTQNEKSKQAENVTNSNKSKKSDTLDKDVEDKKDVLNDKDKKGEQVNEILEKVAKTGKAVIPVVLKLGTTEDTKDKTVEESVDKILSDSKKVNELIGDETDQQSKNLTKLKNSKSKSLSQDNFKVKSAIDRTEERKDKDSIKLKRAKSESKPKKRDEAEKSKRKKDKDKSETNEKKVNKGPTEDHADKKTEEIIKNGLIQIETKKGLNKKSMTLSSIKSNAHEESENNKTVQKQQSYDSSKLRQELKQSEELSKYTSFTPSFNPYKLREEIKQASQDTDLNMKHFKIQANAVLKIQSLWRGYNVRKHLPNFKRKLNKDDLVSMADDEEVAKILLENQALTQSQKDKETGEKIKNIESQETAKELHELKKENDEGMTTPIKDTSLSIDKINEKRNEEENIGKEFLVSKDFQKAALKIQAFWRGFHVRKHMVEGELFGKPVESKESNLKSEILRTVENDNKKSAALKIQALWRGYLVRKNIKDVKKRIAELQKPSECDEMPHQRTLTDEDILNAATKIQAGTRGYITRKHLSSNTFTVIPEEQEAKSLKLDEAIKQLDQIVVPVDSPDIQTPKKELIKSVTVDEPEIVPKVATKLTKALSADSIKSQVEKLKTNSIEDDVNNVQNLVNDSKKNLEQIKEEAKENITEIRKQIKENVTETEKEMKPDLIKIEKTGEKNIKDTETDTELKESLAGTDKKIKEHLTETEKKITGTGKEVQGMLLDTSGEMEESLTEIKEEVKDNITEAENKINESLIKTGKKAEESSIDTGRELNENLSNITDTEEGVKEKLKETESEVKSYLTDIKEELKENVSDTRKEVNENLIKTGEDIKEILLDTETEIKENSTKIKENIIDTEKEVKENLIDAGKEIKEHLSKVKENVTDTAKEGKENLKETENEVKESLTKINEDIKENLTKTEEEVKEAIRNITENNNVEFDENGEKVLNKNISYKIEENNKQTKLNENNLKQGTEPIKLDDIIKPDEMYVNESYKEDNKNNGKKSNKTNELDISTVNKQINLISKSVPNSSVYETISTSIDTSANETKSSFQSDATDFNKLDEKSAQLNVDKADIESKSKSKLEKNDKSEHTVNEHNKVSEKGESEAEGKLESSVNKVEDTQRPLSLESTTSADSVVTVILNDESAEKPNESLVKPNEDEKSLNNQSKNDIKSQQNVNILTIEAEETENKNNKNELLNDVNIAATKIQSSFRGYRVRRDLKAVEADSSIEDLKDKPANIVKNLETEGIAKVNDSEKQNDIKEVNKKLDPITDDKNLKLEEFETKDSAEKNKIQREECRHFLEYETNFINERNQIIDKEYENAINKEASIIKTDIKGIHADNKAVRVTSPGAETEKNAKTEEKNDQNKTSDEKISPENELTADKILKSKNTEKETDVQKKTEKDKEPTNQSDFSKDKLNDKNDNKVDITENEISPQANDKNDILVDEKEDLKNIFIKQLETKNESIEIAKDVSENVSKEDIQKTENEGKIEKKQPTLLDIETNINNTENKVFSSSNDESIKTRETQENLYVTRNKNEKDTLDEIESKTELKFDELDSSGTKSDKKAVTTDESKSSDLVKGEHLDNKEFMVEKEIVDQTKENVSDLKSILKLSKEEDVNKNEDITQPAATSFDLEDKKHKFEDNEVIEPIKTEKSFISVTTEQENKVMYIHKQKERNGNETIKQISGAEDKSDQLPNTEEKISKETFLTNLETDKNIISKSQSSLTVENNQIIKINEKTQEEDKNKIVTSIQDDIDVNRNQKGTETGTKLNIISNEQISTTVNDEQSHKLQSTPNLLHTSEFHDMITIPTTKPQTPATKNEERKDSGSQTTSPQGLINTGELHDGVYPLAVQLNQAPAGVEILTSLPSYSINDDDQAQASNKNASTSSKAQSNKILSAASSGNMETEKRNNASIYNNRKSMETEAATKIQAGFRGYQVRKQLKKINSTGDISKPRRLTRRKSSGRMLDTGRISQQKSKDVQDLEEKSAVKIQAGIRGFLVRRRQKKQKQSKETTP